MNHRNCPFCGADESHLKVLAGSPKGGPLRARVTCPECEATGPSVEIGDEVMEAEDLPAMVQRATQRAWRLWDGEEA